MKPPEKQSVGFYGQGAASLIALRKEGVFERSQSRFRPNGGEEIVILVRRVSFYV